MKISEQFYEYAYIFLADQNAVGSIAEESEYQRLIERAGQRVPAFGNPAIGMERGDFWISIRWLCSGLIKKAV
ncbi:hypothetical protein [Coprococcus sp. AF21-14LB]|uniref:hypothetical protein n=1 Tax=Coprococcus sp. AF21-14LB TaxID=2292231 RepID=UPI000FF13ADD|nr:hypothetical protein [Coprococcus sp. AF21-14LB]RGS79286.1 hypothetical protein DWX73_07775 [Coprococcus sp. AF21-14LB]